MRTPYAELFKIFTCRVCGEKFSHHPDSDAEYCSDDCEAVDARTWTILCAEVTAELYATGELIAICLSCNAPIARYEESELVSVCPPWHTEGYVCRACFRASVASECQYIEDQMLANAF